MSSSHNRSSSTRPSRPTQTVAPLDVQRSASVMFIEVSNVSCYPDFHSE
ncbi:unnamed protein product, partial [Rotaria sp. Silwood1]